VKPAVSSSALRLRDLSSSYGRIRVLHGIDLEVEQGQLVALIGANGAGKSTLLRAISGVQPLDAGTVELFGEDVSQASARQRVRKGMCHCPEGRQVFTNLSVADNLRLGAYVRPQAGFDEEIDLIYTMFPVLREKRFLTAGTLSGGQQQMLAIGRALLGSPRLLLLDEPSMGLSPKLAADIFSTIRTLKDRGATIVLVEQNARAALAVADAAYVIESGRVQLKGSGAELLADDRVRVAYLGM
jgi:branched-chain amino acid transport system ATP-binding protein